MSGGGPEYVVVSVGVVGVCVSLCVLHVWCGLRSPAPSCPMVRQCGQPRQAELSASAAQPLHAPRPARWPTPHAQCSAGNPLMTGAAWPNPSCQPQGSDSAIVLQARARALQRVGGIGRRPANTHNPNWYISGVRRVMAVGRGGREHKFSSSVSTTNLTSRRHSQEVEGAAQ